MIDLKSCPFCGENVQMNDYTKAPRAAWVLMHRCKYTGPILLESRSGDSLAEKWNSRVPSDAQPEMLAWAVVRDEPHRDLIVAINHDRQTAQHLCNPGERVVRVAIRVLDDAEGEA